MVQANFSKISTSTTVQSAKDIHSTLSYAQAHKTQIFVDIISEGKTIHQIRAYCIDHNKSIIRLFVQSKQEIKFPQHAEVSMLFYTEKDGKQVPCNFLSTIKNTFTHKGLFFIDVSVPTPQLRAHSHYEIRNSQPETLGRKQSGLGRANAVARHSGRRI